MTIVTADLATTTDLASATVRELNALLQAAPDGARHQGVVRVP